MVAPFIFNTPFTAFIQVAFTPTASGTRHGDLNLISTAAGSPTIALVGTGTTTAVPGTTTSTPASSGGVSGGTAATNVGNGGCSIGAGDEFDPLWALLLLAAACYVFRDRKGRAPEITDHEHSRRFS